MQNTGPDLSSNYKIVHVAVAVIERFSSALDSSALDSTVLDSIVIPSNSTLPPCREILISKRADDVHQGGFWEFPGGKVEVGEHVTEALSRELFEELGITVSPKNMSALIKVEHDYGDKHVLLDVYTVHSFQGEAIGKEGQPIQWINVNNLLNYTFPDANQSILSSCRLPSFYFITPEYETLALALIGVKEQLDRGVSLFLLRQPKLDVETYYLWVETITDSLPATRGMMLLSGHFDFSGNGCLGDDYLEDGRVGGLHLPFYRAAQLSSRPVSCSKWFGVSCHNIDEIKHAQAIGADFITISPVLHTATHPEAIPLGWDEFNDLVRQANIPAYALGGMMEEYYQKALDVGAQGIAGIRMFLSK
jgi:8-oxo-dGTP diphosphatase